MEDGRMGERERARLWCLVATAMGCVALVAFGGVFAFGVVGEWREGEEGGWW